MNLSSKFGVDNGKIFEVNEPWIRVKSSATKETQQDFIKSLILFVILQNVDELCEKLSNFVSIVLERNFLIIILI